MRKLTLENYSKLNYLSKLANYEEYNSNIVTMLMWNHYYEIYYKLFENYALILVQYPNSKAWLMPLCDKQYLKEAFEAMKQYSIDHHFDFIVPVEVYAIIVEYAIQNEFVGKVEGV